MRLITMRSSSETMHYYYVVAVTMELLLLLPGISDAHPDGDLVEVLEKVSSYHFPMTPPVVPEHPEERHAHCIAMEAKDHARHRQMAECAGSRRRQLATSEEKELGLMPQPKLMSASPTDMTELMSSTSMFELPMRSALTVFDVGMYLVTVRFGTPALPYSMALDTANDLTWVNCRLGDGRRRRSHGRAGPRRRRPVAAKKKAAKSSFVKKWYCPTRRSRSSELGEEGGASAAGA